MAGGGGAGLTAAGTIVASAADLRVTVVELDSALSSNTGVACNFIPAAGTRFQRAAASSARGDVAELAAAHGLPAGELAQTLARYNATTKARA